MQRSTERDPERLATAWATFPEVEVVRPVDAADEAVLQDMREVLARHQALDRFGVMLIHRHFDLEPGEILYESTDLERRQQTIEVRQASEFAEDPQVLQTQWVFDGSGRTLVCVGFCHYANGHKHHHSRK